MLTIGADDPIAVQVTSAIRTGDLRTLEQLLAEHPGLASTRIADGKGGCRTLLHVATDWPGHFPNGAAVVARLVAAGADPNAALVGSWHAETPLHWAASCDDVEVADALITAGANLEALGASIAGGTPLDDAIGYGQWQVARLLLERGARVEKIWHAAALGLRSRVNAFFAADPPPTPDEVNAAFWQACHGGQRLTAEDLLGHGADINYIPPWAKQTPLDQARAQDAQELAEWLQVRGAKSAADLAGA